VTPLIALLAALAGAAPPSGPQPPVAAAPLRVGMNGHYLPLHDVDAGQAEGFEADVARALAEAEGRGVQFLDRTQLGSPLLTALAAGATDVALSALTPTPARTAIVDFTAPIAALEFRVATRAGDPRRDLGAACQKTVGISAGTPAAALRAAKLAIEVKELDSTRAAVELLLSGKVDCVVGEDADLFLAIAETDLVVLDDPIGLTPVAMAVPKGTKAAWDAALGKLAPRLVELRARWGVRAAPAGLVAPRIELPRRKAPLKGGHPLIVAKRSTARAEAKTSSGRVAELRAGELVDAEKAPLAKERWVRVTAGGKPAWIPTDDVVDPKSPIFDLTQVTPEGVPDAPCVDGPCGCLPPGPPPYTEAKLTEGGRRLVDAAFREELASNPNPEVRRRVARVLVPVLFSAAAELGAGRHQFKTCQAECSERAEEAGSEDICCDCGEEEYSGAGEARNELLPFLHAFLGDSDAEVRRQAALAACGVVSATPEPAHLDLLGELELAARCGIEPSPQ